MQRVPMTVEHYVEIPREDFIKLLSAYENRLGGKVEMNTTLIELFERWKKAHSEA